MIKIKIVIRNPKEEDFFFLEQSVKEERTIILGAPLHQPSSKEMESSISEYVNDYCAGVPQNLWYGIVLPEDFPGCLITQKGDQYA